MKKITTILLSFIFALNLNYIAFAVTVDEQITETPITKGVSHTNIKKYTSEGWYNINLLKVDLNEPTVSLKTLMNENTTQKSTVLNLAKQDKNIVGAINSDFFTTYTSSSAAEGMTIIDNKLVTSPSTDPSYATFALTEEETVLMNYFTFNMMVTSKRTNDSSDVLFYNKNAPAMYLKIYDSSFGTKTPGSMDDGIEVVIEDGIVKEVLSNKEGVTIPENGYVLHHSLRHSLFLAQNFQVGDKVALDMSLSPDISKIEQATGGGTLLIQNGTKSKLTLSDSRQPMTACGVDKSGKILYFMTIDGRQTYSIGMTFSEIADYLLKLGCYNAMSFDGGGSTTMVVKYPSEELKAVNLQSSWRQIISAIGVTATKPQGKLSSLKLTKSEESIFLSDSVEIWTHAYDEYYNEYNLNGEQLKYSANKKGTFDKNVFTPKEAGPVTITVTAGKISETIQLNVLEKAVSLRSNIEKFNPLTSAQTFYISGADENGYTANISQKLITTEFISTNGTISNNQLKLMNTKNGAVKFAFSDASVTIPVGDYKVKAEAIKDKFYKSPTQSGYTFGVFGSNTTSLTLFTNYIAGRRNAIANSLNMAAFKTVPTNLTTTTIRVSNYGREDTNHSLFIKLDNSKGGINATKSEQWEWLLNVFKKGVSQKNVFLTLPQGLDKMTDQKEATILVNKLRENLKNKNIFIISYGDSNTYKVKDGIRYITVTDIPKFDSTNTIKTFNNLKYAKFTMNGEDVSFEFAPIF